MLQREVAERVASGPGSKAYGVLSIHVQLDADITTLLTLPPGAFRPPPEVWSQVIRLTFRPPPVGVPDRRLFDVLVRSLFAQRRKTILNTLRPLATSRGLDAGAVLRAAGLDPGRRPETLHLSELAGLADALRPAGTSLLWYSSRCHHGLGPACNPGSPSGLTGPDQAGTGEPFSPDGSRGGCGVPRTRVREVSAGQSKGIVGSAAAIPSCEVHCPARRLRRGAREDGHVRSAGCRIVESAPPRSRARSEASASSA